MDDTIRINDDLTVARYEPQEEDFARIVGEGFRSVVSLQTHEEDQKLKPDEERRWAEDAGLAFFHQPVSGDQLSEEMVDRFRAELAGLPKPSFLHCASGKRSGAMVMMHVAAEQGWTGEQTIEKAESMGFECDTPELEQFVKSYVDARRAG